MNPKASGTESRTEQSGRERQRAEQRTSLREEESCSNEMVGGGGMGCLCRRAPNGETRLSAPSRCNRPAPSCACRRYPGRQQAQRWSRQALLPSDSQPTKLSLSLPLDCLLHCFSSFLKRGQHEWNIKDSQSQSEWAVALYIIQGNRRWFLVKGFEGSLGVVTIYVNHGTVNDQNQNVWKLHDPAAWSLNREERIKQKNVSWPVSRAKNIIVLLSFLPPGLSSAAFTCFLWLVITFYFYLIMYKFDFGSSR